MYKCNICGKEFDSPFKLGGHKSSHNRGKRKNLKQQICEFCSKSFLVSNHKKGRFCSLDCFYSFQKEEKNKALVKIRTKSPGVHILDITNQELDLYRKEHKVCEICGKEEIVSTGKKKVNNLAVDHNHQTGHFRGLLCYSCNIKIGWIESNWERTKQYLEKDNFKF